MLVCTPLTLPLLFQGVSASDLPTKSISLTPTNYPGRNLVAAVVWLVPEFPTPDTVLAHHICPQACPLPSCPALL
jgi:hypothetical protein